MMDRLLETRPVPGYEGRYSVTGGGHVISWAGRRGRGGHYLKQMRSPNGYLRVRLYDGNGNSELCFVHRLVAMAFIPNPEGKPQVNHKNGDKSCNGRWNLEWVSASENLQHRREVLGKCRTSDRPVVCLETGEVYPSATAAAAALNLTRSAVSSCCLGIRKHTQTLHFKFKEEKIHD